MTNRPKPGLFVLVVEDEMLIATSLEIVLESNGHRVLGPVATVDAARAALEHAQPDLALIDYRLADSTTEPLLPDLRQRHIPACVLTGYSRDQLPESYADCHVLEKPFRMRALLEAIDVMLQQEQDGHGA
jgi:DNA-binding response OmpR family regulator